MHISTLDRAKVCSNLRCSQIIFKLKLKVKKFKTEYQKTEIQKMQHIKWEHQKEMKKKKLAEKIFDSTMIEIFQN